MSKLPRILPLVAVAVGGVLAVRAVAGLEGAPAILQGARAWAEEAAPAPKGKPVAKPSEAKAAEDAASPAAASVAARAPAPVCAASAAELARDAGLSPAELRVLQSLGARRGELDARESAFETQVALLNTAETKLDAKLAALNALKAELNGLLGQTDAKREAEVARLVKVYESMKPKDAAARMTILDDRVRLPVAARMKERNLAAVLAQMPPADAKELTEKLADRLETAAIGARVASALAPAATPPAASKPPAAQGAPAATAPPAASPVKAAPRRPRPKPAAKPVAKPPAAAATPPASAPAVAAPPPVAAAQPATPLKPAKPKPTGDGPV